MSLSRSGSSSQLVGQDNETLAQLASHSVGQFAGQFAGQTPLPGPVQSAESPEDSLPSVGQPPAKRSKTDPREGQPGQSGQSQEQSGVPEFAKRLKLGQGRDGWALCMYDCSPAQTILGNMRQTNERGRWSCRACFNAQRACGSILQVLCHAFGLGMAEAE